MNISIVFNNTGDSVSFTPVNYDIAVYYVEWLDSINKNNFSFRSVNTQLTDLLKSLDASIKDNASVIRLLGGKPMATYDELGYLNQDNLNELHAAWVNLHHLPYDIKSNQLSANIDIAALATKVLAEFSDDMLFPAIDLILNRLGLMDNYGLINTYIHQIEDNIRQLTFKTDSWIQTDNIFPKSRLTNNISNLRIGFNHLGRTLYNKFETFDNELKHDDENSFNELVGYVDVTLAKPQTIPLSGEYINWCKNHNKIPSGNRLNLGNLSDIDTKLTKYRQIFYRNIKNKNTFSLQIN